ncbi:MAG: sigma-70 family RNA polymerase sigma factor, partial [Sciscionella sp.]
MAGLPDPAAPLAPSDEELIAAVRAGSRAAFGTLFARHRDAALRLARQLAGASDADDIVSDAFTRVFRALRRGAGPDVAFRAYLLSAVRRLHVDRIRAGKRLTPTDVEDLDVALPFTDPAIDEFENAAAARAFATLPERWQLVLWQVDIEGNKPAAVAPVLGISSNAVSALAYRAREGLKQAYLQMHLAPLTPERCRWSSDRLGAYVRHGLGAAEAARVEEHLTECARCRGLYAELSDVNSNMSGVFAPILLGTAATGYLASAAGHGGLAVLGGWFTKGTGLVRRNSTTTGIAVAAVVIAAAVAFGAIALLGNRSHPPDVTARLAAGALPKPTSASSAQSPASNASSPTPPPAAVAPPPAPSRSGPAGSAGPLAVVPVPSATADTPSTGATSPASRAPATTAPPPPVPTTVPPPTTSTTPPPAPITTPPTTTTPPLTPPQLNLSVHSGGVPLTVTVTASDAGPGRLRYLFDFGDPAGGGGRSAVLLGGTNVVTQSSPTASHIYTTAGTYTVTVTVSDAAGQSATATTQITAYPTPVARLTVCPGVAGAPGRQHDR